MSIEKIEELRVGIALFLHKDLLEIFINFLKCKQIYLHYTRVGVEKRGLQKNPGKNSFEPGPLLYYLIPYHIYV